MKELNIEQMDVLCGGNFVDGFCAAVGIFSAGAGLAVLAGVTVATGGTAAWLWGGSVAACAVYGVYTIAT